MAAWLPGAWADGVWADGAWEGMGDSGDEDVDHGGSAAPFMQWLPADYYDDEENKKKRKKPDPDGLMKAIEKAASKR